MPAKKELRLTNLGGTLVKWCMSRLVDLASGRRLTLPMKARRLRMWNWKN
jgi:hypothetical protein